MGCLLLDQIVSPGPNNYVGQVVGGDGAEDLAGIVIYIWLQIATVANT